MTTLTRLVPGMTCGHCVAAVTGEVSKVPGVDSVTIDLDAKLVTITGAALVDNAASEAAIRAAVEEAGFDECTAVS